MMRDALLIVPPVVHYAAGPALGPASLAGAAREAGFEVDVIDLNIHCFERIDTNAVRLTSIVGDHAKADPRECRGLDEFEQIVAEALHPLPVALPAGVNPVRALTADFERIDDAVAAVFRRYETDWTRLLGSARPGFVGVSVMFSEQVVAALAVGRVVRRLWPGTPVVWGGAHVTGLAREIAADSRYGREIDGFVAGYAEQTFVAMLRASDPRSVDGVFRAGERLRSATGTLVTPRFDHLDPYGLPRLTLPAQTSRGCAYGRCTFCTYPAVEGRFDGGGYAHLASVIALAEGLGADIAFKDALMLPDRTNEVAALVSNRVRWSMTTRVRPAPTRDRLARWVSAGLATVELGVESVSPDVLRSVGKRQRIEDLEAWLAAAAGLDVHVVLNVMCGFPRETRESAVQLIEYVSHELVERFSHTRFSSERNILQILRRAPLATSAVGGVEVTRRWPWAAIVDWNQPRWVREFEEEMRGHHMTAAFRGAA
jgi:hypothetical protein